MKFITRRDYIRLKRVIIRAIFGSILPINRIMNLFAFCLGLLLKPRTDYTLYFFIHTI